MSDARRRIAIVTGSRAEYGLLSWLARDIAADPQLDLVVIATGMHLSPRFGATIAEIRADGFDPIAVPCLEADDDRLSIVRSVGRAVSGLAEAMTTAQPDVVLVLGDRFEILAAAQAALLLGIPLAHVHGGELTEGAVDDSIRHAITKMASLHFAAAERYARRIIQMGEPPERVFTVGAPGVDAVQRLDPLPNEQLDCDLGLALAHPLFLATYHPVTLRTGDDGVAVDALTAALDTVPGARIIVTGVNADNGHRVVAERLEAWVATNSARVSLHASLGQRRYLSVLRLADCVIGNSSSGLIEAPAAGIPTVNIGERQKGRLRAASVIDCSEDTGAIQAAITRALDPAFRLSYAGTPPPYGGGDTSGRILTVLKSADLSTLVRKPFCDLPEVP